MECKKGFNETDLIVPCGCCAGLFHGNYSNLNTKQSGKNCANINASEEKVLILVKEHLMIYQCAKCKENKGINPKVLEFLNKVEEKMEKIDKVCEIYDNLATFNEDVIKMKHDVNNVGDEITKVKEEYIPQNNNEIRKEMYHETYEISKKSRNIIIRGIKDENDKNKDHQEIIKLFNAVGVQHNNNYCKRLGKYDSKKRGNRPIVVYLKSADEVKVFIMNKDKIEDGIKVSRDKTEFIRKLEKEAYEEKEERSNKGETNLEVRWVKDVPKVVKKVNKDTKNPSLQPQLETT